MVGETTRVTVVTTVPEPAETPGLMGGPVGGMVVPADGTNAGVALPVQATSPFLGSVKSSGW